DPVAGEEHHLHRADQVLAERLAELGDRLRLDAGATGAAPRRARGGLRRAACLLLAPARLAALLGGGAALGRGRARARGRRARARRRAAASGAARPARLPGTSAASALGHLLPSWSCGLVI